MGFNPFDPIQDTESGGGQDDPGGGKSFNPFDPIQDTERDTLTYRLRDAEPGFNPFDPIQDTERPLPALVHHLAVPVSTHSIRYRILKVSSNGDGAWALVEFQPIRSDTGY